MKKRLRIAHTSDVHLDGRSKTGASERYKNVAEHAFAEVIRATNELECDLLLIVGDLFDHNRIQETDIEFVRSQLRELKCPTVLIPGNHDVFDQYSLWHRFNPDELGTNVFSIMEHEGTSIDFENLGVRIWGRAMAEHAPENKPLAGTPELNNQVWNIGLAHGQVVEKRVFGSSSLITEEEITESGFDYLALGHVHVWATFEYGNVVACYPGSPVAAYASSKGGYLAIVDFDDEEGISIRKHRVETLQIKSEPIHGTFFSVP